MSKTAFDEEDDDQEVSLYALTTALLRSRWQILAGMLVGGILASMLVWSRPSLYAASASFVPQGADAGRSGLANLAGQFGVTLPSGNQSLTPDFYSRLLKSQLLLRQVARDSFQVAEMNNRKMSFFSLFGIEGGTQASSEEQAINLLSKMVSTPTPARTTGIVELSATTEWPSVSLAIVARLVAGINDYNQRMRQTQASAERKFIEGRLEVASSDLRVAEDRMEHFLSGNLQIGNSAQLNFERERLQRDLTLKQQVFTSLTQAYEDARIREVRDAPVVALVESPTVSTRPLPRGRGIRILIGLFLGALIGAVPALKMGLTGNRRRGDREAEELAAELAAFKRDLSNPFRRLRRKTA